MAEQQVAGELADGRLGLARMTLVRDQQLSSVPGGRGPA
jgi:hypothetical protein